MSISLGPLTVSWGSNPSSVNNSKNNNSNTNLKRDVAFLAIGTIAGAAGTYFAPTVGPQVTAVIVNGTNTVTNFAKGLFEKKPVLGDKTPGDGFDRMPEVNSVEEGVANKGAEKAAEKVAEEPKKEQPTAQSSGGLFSWFSRK